MQILKVQGREWAIDCLRQSYINWCKGLSPGQYNLQEELPSGRLITHLRGVAPNVIADYICMAFIDSEPPRFTIHSI